MNFWRSIQKPIIGLSPMDGVTDASFRYITAKHGGPDVTYTEFVNIQAAFYAPHTLIRDLTYSEVERPIVAQIYGRSPELFYKVAHIVGELGFDGLDVNMGCPAKKVAASGCGAALIRTPELARAIIRAAQRGIEDWCDGQSLADIGISPELVAAIAAANIPRGQGMRRAAPRRKIPLSVKTRLGYDRVIVDDWIAALLEEKPAVISLHGRTLQQGYKGSADWDAIARAVEIAKNSGTMILGNGDVQDMNQAYGRVRGTAVDGVLLGRAAQGNPWIFRDKDRVKAALHTGGPLRTANNPIDLVERFRVILEHSQHCEQYAGGGNFVAIRKHLTWYCRGFRGASEMRARMVRVASAADVIECLAGHANAAASDRQRDGERPGEPWPVVSLSMASFEPR